MDLDLSGFWVSAWQLATTFGVRVVGALVALLLGWIAASWLRRLMLAGFTKSKFDATLSRFFANMARYALLTFTVLGVLGVFGIETSSFAAVLAAAGLAIGLAFQGTLSNFSAGVMLLVFRPFKVGDDVVAGGVTGTVLEIDLFHTEITTPDNRRLIVPNGSIFGAVIENKTHFETRRVDVNIGLPYAADVDATRKALEGALEGIDHVLEDPHPQVVLTGLSATTVDWSLRAWCKTKDTGAVGQALLRAAKNAVDPLRAPSK